MSAALDYVTTPELLSLGLDGWPTTARGWRLRRDREGWQIAETRGPRGIELIEVASLPADLRAKIVARRADAFRPKPANDEKRGRGRPKGSGWFDTHPDAATAVLSWIAVHKHAATTVHRLLKAEFGAAGLPSLRSIRRYIAELEAREPALLLRERNPDLSKGRHQLALGRADGSVDRAHQVWELDTTKADVMTLGGRRMVLGLIDRWSRRVRFLVAPSESGQSVRRLLIDTITAWGVMPETVVTDNGSGYINASIVTALALLGIEHKPCLPGTPEHKPFVERLFGTFTRTRAVLLDGFTGHNVAQATEIRARAKKRTGRAEIVAHLTPEELQAQLDQWTDGTYHLEVHGGIGMSPMAKWQSSPVPARAAASPDQLRMALSALVGARLIGKRGLVWNDGRYWAAELAGWIGRTVLVRRDEEELGELLVFDEDGHFICTALNHERAGISERDHALAARNHQRAEQKLADARVREAKRRFPIERARDALLREEAERAGRIVNLPRPTVKRSTPQLDSLVPVVPAIVDEAALIRAEARVPERARRDDRPVAAKVAEADAVLAAAAAGQTIAPDRLAAAAAYAHSREYRAEKLLTGDFTPSAPATPVHLRSI